MSNESSIQNEKNSILTQEKNENLNQVKTDTLNFEDSIQHEMKKLDIPLQEGWRWRLLRVKSGKEFLIQKKLEEDYSDSIASVFIPFYISPMKRNNTIVQTKRVIHPGYFYCLCKKTGYHEALRMIYKQLDILLYVASDKHVNLDQVKNMCYSMQNRVENSLFKEGDSVQILSGIWKDFSGIVISVNNTNVKKQWRQRN